MSLAETWLEFEAHKQTLADQFDRDTIQAWQVVRIYIETMGNKGRMPTLKSLLHEQTKPKKGKKQDLQIALQMLAAQYGGRVRNPK